MSTFFIGAPKPSAAAAAEHPWPPRRVETAPRAGLCLGILRGHPDGRSMEGYPNPFVELPKMFVDLYAFINQSESLSEDRDDDSGDPSAFQGAADHHDDDSGDDDHDELICFRALMIDLCTNLDTSSYGTLGRLSLCKISFARARPSLLWSYSK